MAVPLNIARQGVRAASPFWVIALGRFALNLPARAFYPFLPFISRSLGVDLSTASLLLTARAVASAFSPVWGALADRWGQRPLMLAGLGLSVTGAFLVLLAPGFGWVLVAFGVLATAKAMFDPAMFAYLGDNVPYERRGRVMGLLSMTWPGIWLVGVPITGFLMARWGWQSPFWLVAALGVLALIATGKVILPAAGGRSASLIATRDHYHSSTAAVLPNPARIPAWLTLPTVGALVVNLLQVTARENMFIVYGVWLEDQFGLSIAALGLASIVVALAEFSAEGASAGFVDRMGKRRAVLIGLALTVAAYLLLPRLAGALSGALAGVFFMSLVYDFSIVTMLALLTELAPAARALLMALNVAALAGARFVSSLVAPRLWEAGGLDLTATVSAVLTGAALIVLWSAVREGGAAPKR